MNKTSLLYKFLLILTLGASFLSAQDTVRVYLSTEDVVQAGADFTLDLNLANPMGVRGVDLNLTADPNVITFMQVDTTNRTAGFMVADTVYNEETLRILLTDFGGNSILPGDGAILHLRYHVSAAASGVIQMNFSDVVIAGSGSTNFPANAQALTLDVYTGNADENGVKPANFDLLRNYPNPFNPGTQIQLNLAQAQQGNLAIYNVLGKRIVELKSGEFQVGLHNFYWNGLNNERQPASSGIYICRFNGVNTALQQKIVLMR